MTTADGQHESKRLALGVLASGTGTNFDAIAAAIDDGRLQADIAVLICNRTEAKVLAKAKTRGIHCLLIPHAEFPDRETFDTAVADALEAAGTELVVLAGFDRIVTAALLDRFTNRMVNIHPALLPAFKGTDAQAQAADYGVAIAGATVHFVDEHMDHGPIIVQAAVPVAPGEDAHTVQQRILAQEHRIYPYAIQLFAEGRLRVDGRNVVIDGRPAPDDSALISPPIPW